MAVVRRIRADEWAAWRDFRNRSLADAPDAFGTTLAESLRRDEASWRDRVLATATSDESCMFVAEDDDGTWLACAGGHREDGSVQVISVWTDPAARGTGLGRRTCEAVVEWAREVGERRLRLWVVDGNDAALALYQGLGFTPTGRRQLLREGLAEAEFERILE